MRKFLIVFLLFLSATLSPMTAIAEEPDAFTARLLREIDAMETTSRKEIGAAMAPRGDTLLGKTIVISSEQRSISGVIDQILIELGVSTEIGPVAPFEINESDYEKTIWFMAIVQATTDGLEKRQFSLPNEVVCEDIKNSGRTFGYFDPYGFYPGCPIVIPRDFSDVRRLITKHSATMQETWGVVLPDNFLPWNCPQQNWPPSYGKQLWGIISRYGLPVVPTNTPRPERTRTPVAPTATPTITQTPMGTLTPQPTATATTTPIPPNGESFSTSKAIIALLLLLLIVFGFSGAISNFSTKYGTDLMLFTIGAIAFTVAIMWLLSIVELIKIDFIGF